MELNRADIDLWLHAGINIKTRTLYLGHIGDSGGDEDPGIHWATARRMIMGLHILEVGSKRPITILMNSGGGDWNHGMAIFDAIRSCRNRVTIINMSQAASMTSIILQAADYRITSPHGHYMIHDGHVANSGTPRSMANTALYEKTVELPNMYSIYLTRLRERDSKNRPKIDIDVVAEILNPKLPEGAERIQPERGVDGILTSHIQQLCSQDTYFTAEEMIKLNFADRILKPDDLAGVFDHKPPSRERRRPGSNRR